MSIPTHAASSPEQTIPTVNLMDFLDGTPEARENFVQTSGKALKELGFFALEGHGVDSGLIKNCYQQAELFFALPTDQKRALELADGSGQRGYTSFGREHAKGESAPDLKEFYHVGQLNSPKDAISGEVYPANLWPTEAQVPGFTSNFSTLYTQLETCALQLLDALSLYLGVPKPLLRETATHGNSILRVIHYPPIASDRNPASIRAAAHEDINLITLLCESTAEGLELLQRDGTWLPIRAIPGQIIVDSGDMIQNLTNGILKSTTHRVINPAQDRDRRFSMPFFVHPRSEVPLNPHPTCVERVGEPRFPNITAGQYLAQRLAEIGLHKAK